MWSTGLAFTIIIMAVQGAASARILQQGCNYQYSSYPTLSASDPDNTGVAGTMGAWNAVDGDLTTAWDPNPGLSVYRLIISRPSTTFSYVLVYPATDGTHSPAGMRVYSSQGQGLLAPAVTTRMSNVVYSVQLNSAYAGSSIYIEFDLPSPGYQPIIYDIQFSTSPIPSGLVARDVNGDATYGGMDVSKLVDNNMGTAWDLMPSGSSNPRPISQVAISNIPGPVDRLTVWPGDATHAPTMVQVYQSDNVTLLGSFSVSSPGSVIQITFNKPYYGGQLFISFSKTTQWQIVVQEVVLNPYNAPMVCGLAGSPGCVPAASASFSLYPVKVRVVSSDPSDGGCHTMSCAYSVADDDLSTNWNPGNNGRTTYSITIATVSGASTPISAVLIYLPDTTHAPTSVTVWDAGHQNVLGQSSGPITGIILQIPTTYYMGSSVVIDFVKTTPYQLIVAEIRLSSYQSLPSLHALDMDAAPTMTGMTVAALVDNNANPWDPYLGGQPWLPSGAHTYRVIISNITTPVEQVTLFGNTDGDHSISGIYVYSDPMKTQLLQSLDAVACRCTAYGVFQQPSYKLPLSTPFLGSSLYIELKKTNIPVPGIVDSNGMWQIIVPEIIVQSNTHLTPASCS